MPASPPIRKTKATRLSPYPFPGLNASPASLPAIEIPGEGPADLHQRLAELQAELTWTNELLREEGRARRKLEIELHESEQRFIAFMDNSPAMAFIKDADGRYLYTNKRWDTFFASQLASGAERRDILVHPPALARKFREEDREILERGVSLECEYPYPQPDGGVRWCLLVKFPILNPLGRAFVGGVALDITERRERERQVLEVSEREQQRIGRDLHDELCQYLTAIKLKAGMLEWRLEKENPEAAREAHLLEEMLMTALGRAHRVARGLHPVRLEHTGLIPGLRDLAENLSTIYSCSCICRVRGRVDISDPAQAVHLYRVAQEAIVNAIKHGKATRVTIELRGKKDSILLCVTDNGTGIVAGKPDGPGMGLHLMHYHARMIGGSMRLANRARGGAMLTCTLPRSATAPAL